MVCAAFVTLQDSAAAVTVSVHATKPCLVVSIAAVDVASVANDVGAVSLTVGEHCVIVVVPASVDSAGVGHTCRS